jgi:hypothetical protein
MLYHVITVNKLHHQELLHEAEHSRLVQAAMSAHRKVEQPAVLSRDSVLSDMGHGLMAVGLPSLERRVPRKVYP